MSVLVSQLYPLNHLAKRCGGWCLDIARMVEGSIDMATLVAYARIMHEICMQLCGSTSAFIPDGTSFIHDLSTNLDCPSFHLASGALFAADPAFFGLE